MLAERGKTATSIAINVILWLIWSVKKSSYEIRGKKNVTTGRKIKNTLWSLSFMEIRGNRGVVHAVWHWFIFKKYLFFSW